MFDMSHVRIGVGGDIVFDSFEWQEWFESAIKAGAIKRPRTNGIHYSDVGKSEINTYTKEPLFCYRQCVLAYCGYNPSATIYKPETLWNFELGWRIHEAVQEILVNAGYAVEVERGHVAEQYNLAFTPDAIVVKDGKKYLLEVKGYQNKKFDADVKANKPDLDARRQVNTYMGLLGEEYHQAIILEICKGKSETGKWFHIWEVTYDEAMSQEVMRRLDAIKSMAEDHERYIASDVAQQIVLPPRLSNCKSGRSVRAKECSMREACFAKDKKKLLEMRVNNGDA